MLRTVWHAVNHVFHRRDRRLYREFLELAHGIAPDPATEAHVFARARQIAYDRRRPPEQKAAALGECLQALYDAGKPRRPRTTAPRRPRSTAPPSRYVPGSPQFGMPLGSPIVQTPRQVAHS